MNRQGMTLLEIIIVVSVIGILSGLTIPRIAEQIEANRFAEVVQTFGTLRRAAQTCLQVNGGATSLCSSPDLLSVTLPVNTGSFDYEIADAGGFIILTATRVVNGTPNTIMMTLGSDGQGEIDSAAINVDPSESPYRFMVARLQSSMSDSGLGGLGTEMAR